MFTISIIIAFGIVGILVKKKYERENEFYKFLKNFHQYYISNVSLFKNNVVEIIDNYIIMHKNKSANYIKIFAKSNNIYQFNHEIIERNIIKKEDAVIVLNYLNNIGKGEYVFEKEKIYEFSKYLDVKIDESLIDLKNKGELYFKLLLAIGAVIAIILWWKYGCFNII